MRQNLAYVMGPYRAETEWGVAKNIKRAEELAARLWAGGIPNICPHKNSAFMGGVAPDKTFLESDLLMLRACKVGVVTVDYMDSKGTLAEIELCRDLKMPVFYDDVELMLISEVDKYLEIIDNQPEKIGNIEKASYQLGRQDGLFASHKEKYSPKNSMFYCNKCNRPVKTKKHSSLNFMVYDFYCKCGGFAINAPASWEHLEGENQKEDKIDKS